MARTKSTNSITCRVSKTISQTNRGPYKKLIDDVKDHPKTQRRIKSKSIGRGMSIPECQAAMPNSRFEFVDAYVGKKSPNLETWRVWTINGNNIPVWLYLHLKDGRVEEMTEIQAA